MKRKSQKDSNWDNFELRNFNHDLGRWSAPDPYGQFHSPYIAMGNNPVSMIDPNGGYIYTSDAGMNQRKRFLESLDRDRMHERGRFDFEYLHNNYKAAIAELVQHHKGEGNFFMDEANHNDEGLLKAILRLNNDYLGLGLPSEIMSSGRDYISFSSLKSDVFLELLENNGTLAMADEMSKGLPDPSMWMTASPAERAELGIKNGIYEKSYSLVGAFVSKRQVGEMDSESGESDDFVTGYTFYYESNDGSSYHTYVNAFPTGNNNVKDNPNKAFTFSSLVSTVGLFGVAVGYAETFSLAGQGQYITSKGVVRNINPANLTAHSKPYATAGKVLKTWGRTSVGIVVAIDSYSWWNGGMSTAKFGLNTGVTGWSLGAGAAGMAIPGFIGGAVYYGVDTFYPGGWNGAMNDQSKLNKENSFNPYWQLWPSNKL